MDQGRRHEPFERRRRPTLAEVARLAGVSVSTASRVANDHPSVNADTREAVHRAIAALGYRTSQLGRALVLQRSNTIGLLAPEITNPYFPELILAIEQESRREDYVSILMSVEETESSTEAYTERMLDQGVDGLIVAGARSEEGYLAALRDQGIPIVIVNRPHPAFRSSYVVPDFQAGGALATRHLLELGHERIAYIAGPAGFGPSDARLRGHLQALAEAGAEYARIVHLEEFSPTEARTAAVELVRADRPPTAIAVVNDYCALGVLAGADDAALRVPDDVAVLGYDDIWVSELPSVRLSSVSSHTQRMGELAAQMLLEMIRQGTGAADPIVLAPELRVRRSCGGGQ